MKNIHILPTDKSSRLHYFTANKAGYYLYPNNELIVPRNPNCINQNIYITSDEQAKEGDWGYIPFQGGDVKLVGKYFADDWKKIILTTDQSLDGVQPIDDEFLEWFVNNPSCEEVEVVIEKFILQHLFKPQEYRFRYKIIIPKEKPKQETLEEALLEFKKSNFPFGNTESLLKIAEFGAKWQQERSYSEEEGYNIAQQLRLQLKTGVLKWQDDFEFDLEKWFEQFKKK